MTLDPAQLPDDIATLKTMLITAMERANGLEAQVKTRLTEIENLKLTIAKLQRDKFGASSERGRKLLDQLELQLAELEEGVAQDTAAAEIKAPPVAPQSDKRDDKERRKPARRPLPEKLPRERVVHPAPSACPCCGGHLRKLGEDITETLEHVPAQWKVIQHVREKFSCRTCETITQPPAPSHPIARGRAGPQLLAQVLFAKYRAHLPLNRQSDIYAEEGIDLDVSTLADWVGACAATLMPLVEAIRKHVFAAERIHADDTTVPVLASGKCRTGRLWAYVRDDRPFGGRAAPAAILYYSPDRSGEHPERHLASYSGVMQADAYAGFNGLYVARRRPGPIIEAACWAHGRRKLYELAELQKSPIAIEAVRRIDELFAIEREINGHAPDRRLAVRRQRSKPLVDDLEKWLRDERRKLSSKTPSPRRSTTA
jgi:transposase